MSPDQRKFGESVPPLLFSSMSLCNGYADIGNSDGTNSDMNGKKRSTEHERNHKCECVRPVYAFGIQACEEMRAITHPPYPMKKTLTILLCVLGSFLIVGE